MAVSLYPEQTSYDSGHIATGDGHELYYERHGNPDAAEKIIYLHGGPGAGCGYHEYRWFDPQHFDVLLFDQRWAPKSKPGALVGENGVDLGVADVERLRRHFGYGVVNIIGGSYGSLLGSLYTVRHPQFVKRALLRGIFLGSKKEADFLYEENGAAAIARNHWFDEMKDYIPEAERAGGLGAAYLRRIMGTDDALALEAERFIALWNMSSATATPRQDIIDDCLENMPRSLNGSRTYFHFVLHSFSDDLKREVFEGLGRLTIPVDIVHGRQDYVCSVETGIALHEACKDSRLQIIENCGHSMKEPALQEAFITVTNRWMQEDLSRMKPANPA